MKKTIITAFTAALLVIGMTSCGNSMEKDAKKASDLTCELFDLQMKAMSGDEKATEKVEKLEAESQELIKRLEKTYQSEEDHEKFGKLVEENLKNCDAYKKMMEAFSGLEGAFQDNMDDAMDGLEDAFGDFNDDLED